MIYLNKFKSTQQNSFFFIFWVYTMKPLNYYQIYYPKCNPLRISSTHILFLVIKIISLFMPVSFLSEIERPLNLKYTHLWDCRHNILYVSIYIFFSA